jgi:hypothetical protein
LQTDLYTPATRPHVLRSVERLTERGLIVCKKVLYENKKFFLTAEGWREVLALPPLNRAEWAAKFKPFLDLKVSGEELGTLALYLLARENPALAAFRLEVPRSDVIRTITRLEIRQGVESAKPKELN